MKNRIVFFSGGKSSFKVAHYVKHYYPDDNILLLFTDTNFEDEDLYRFIKEGSGKLELPLLWLNAGKTPLELMKNDNFLYNSRVANCSYKLKVVPARDFIKKQHLTPEWRVENKKYQKQELFAYCQSPVLYFGIGFEEAHRQGAIRKNWRPYQVEMPLIEAYIDDDILASYDIKQPQLYDMGFSHNNCAGRCVKGGQGHWTQLYRKDRDKFNQMRDFEIGMNEQINEYKKNSEKYAFMKKQGRPYQIHELEKDLQNQPEQIDLFDFGACGCFVEEGR